MIKKHYVKILPCPVFHVIWNSISLKVPRLRPLVLHILLALRWRWVSLYVELMEYYWQVKSEVLGEKLVPLPLYPPWIPHRLALCRTRSSGESLRIKLPEPWNGLWSLNLWQRQRERERVSRQNVLRDALRGTALFLLLLGNEKSFLFWRFTASARSSLL